MIHSEILSALKPLGVPVSFHVYSGDDTTYITFFQYDESEVLSANDTEAITNYYYQVNVFSKSDYSKLVKDIKTIMRDIGGIRLNETEFFYDDMYYQRSIRFKFTKYNGGF